MVEIEIPTVANDPESLPVYASALAAGADVRACIKEPLIIEPSASALIPTGLRFAIPAGYEIQVRPRSGFALKNQVTVLNSPGTIDADYRGELGVILINHGKNTFIVTPGMRIAQIVLARVERAIFSLEESLMSTSRGENGFGHTGAH
jgi:dUTP pyrophosphatase